MQGLRSARSFPSIHTFPKVSSVLGLVLGSEVTNMLNTWPPPFENGTGNKIKLLIFIFIYGTDRKKGRCTQETGFEGWFRDFKAKSYMGKKLRIRKAF